MINVWLLRIVSRRIGSAAHIVSVKELLDGMARDGWAVMPTFMEKCVALRLVEECQTAAENGEFRKAGVGRGQALVIREDIRRDEVMWLREESLTTGQKDYLERLEDLAICDQPAVFPRIVRIRGAFRHLSKGRVLQSTSRPAFRNLGPHRDGDPLSESRLATGRWWRAEIVADAGIQRGRLQIDRTAFGDFGLFHGRRLLA